MARPNHKPDARSRGEVETMAGLGMRQEDICLVIGIGSKATLNKYYRTELDAGKAKARARVLQTLFQMATSGRNFPATKFWIEQQAGDEWHGIQRLEITGLREMAAEMAGEFGITPEEAIAEAEALLAEASRKNKSNDL